MSRKVLGAALFIRRSTCHRAWAGTSWVSAFPIPKGTCPSRETGDFDHDVRPDILQGYS